MNQLDFNGRHAVITGGATGLGYAIAQRLIASGGTVTLWDRDDAAAQQAARALGASTRSVAVDVAQHGSVLAAVQATVKKEWGARLSRPAADTLETHAIGRGTITEFSSR